MISFTSANYCYCYREIEDMKLDSRLVLVNILVSFNAPLLKSVFEGGRVLFLIFYVSFRITI